MNKILCFIIIAMIILYIVQYRSKNLEQKIYNLTNNNAFTREQNRINKVMAHDQNLFEEKKKKNPPKPLLEAKVTNKTQ